GVLKVAVDNLAEGEILAPPANQLLLLPSEAVNSLIGRRR
ncbi:unnamed protein product, partial [marine sediment metagenome]